MLPPLGVVLLLLATLLCPPAMAQFPQQQGWPYSNQYQYQQQQQPNTFYRQFGAQTPYGSYAPTFGPRSFGGGASSPYSAANSYYGYGTNSPAFYQQNRVPADCSPFGQNPFGGGAGGYPRYPFYPQQQQQFAGGQGHQQYFASPPMMAGQQPSAFYSTTGNDSRMTTLDTLLSARQ